MRLIVLLSALFLVAPAGWAQRHKLTINAETPEGQMLQQIGQESDAAKKLALLEQFSSQHPKHEAVGWVYSQMIPAYAKAEQYDKAMEAGEKLLALDPGDVEAAHACLKAAEATKNPDSIKKWAVQTSEAARKTAESKKPESGDEDEIERWKRQVDFAKQVDTYTEYALYATALQATDPRKKIELADTLKQRNPESQYVPQLEPQVFLAYRQLGDSANAVAIALKVLEKDQSNEDMLLVVADYYFNQKKEHDKVLSYSTKLVEVLKDKPAPEGVSAEDWQKKKDLSLGLGYWMKGVTYSNQKEYSEADSTLREALPFIKGNDQLLAGALFHLGLANYKLGEKGPDTQRILDALKFNQQCAGIKSPFQAQAQRNITVIRSQYRIK